jgi:hypothetical protein
VQRLAQDTIDVPGWQEDVIRVQESITAVEAAHVEVVRVVVAYAREAAVTWEGVEASIKETEARATLAEREPRKGC